jgi:hypothetical protein
MDYRIVCPSYKRAGRVGTRKVFPEAILAVHEFEADRYRDKQGGEIAVMPDALRGNMARVRNWILDNFGSDPLIMVDDDIDTFTRVQNLKYVDLAPATFREYIEVGWQMAEDCGAFLWGVNLQRDRLLYREYSPLSFLSPVLGPFSCVRPNPLRYDTRLSLNEDYDYFLQHLRRYHHVLRFNFLYYFAKHLTESGGCASYRLLPEERRQAEIMIAKWGPKVAQYDFTQSFNPRIHPPYKGI